MERYWPELEALAASRDTKPESESLAKHSGFSSHAGVMAEGYETQKRTHLCHYITRSAVSEKRQSLTTNGQVRYSLKTHCRDGTTCVLFDPLDFLVRLAARVPKPSGNLTRNHGVLAPNSADRGQITPGGRGRGKVNLAVKTRGMTIRRIEIATELPTGVLIVFRMDSLQYEMIV